MTQDKIGALVENGCFNLAVMKETRITRERVFGQLRSKEINNLGEVKRLYLEANGTFTFIENKEPVAGLSIIPAWDSEFKMRVSKESGAMACNHCGHIREQHPAQSECSSCGFNDWTNAVESVSK